MGGALALKITLAYDKQGLEVELPDENVRAVLRKPVAVPLKAPEGAVREGLEARGVEVLFDGGLVPGRRTGGWTWSPRTPLPCGTQRLGLQIDGRFLPARDKVYRVDRSGKAVELGWSMAQYARSPSVEILDPDRVGQVMIRVVEEGDGMHGLHVALNGVGQNLHVADRPGEVLVPYDARHFPGFREGQANTLVAWAPNAWGHLNGKAASRVLPMLGGIGKGGGPGPDDPIQQAWEQGDHKAVVARCRERVADPVRQQVAPVEVSAELLGLCALSALELGNKTDASDFQQAAFDADPLHVPRLDGVRTGVRDGYLSRQLRLLRGRPELALPAWERATAYAAAGRPVAVVLLMYALFDRPDPGLGTEVIIDAYLLWAAAELELGEVGKAADLLEIALRLDPGVDTGRMGFVAPEVRDELDGLLAKVRTRPGRADPEPESPEAVFFPAAQHRAD